MCVVSTIINYGLENFDNTFWNDDVKYEEFRRLLAAARKFDKATGQPDCPTADWAAAHGPDVSG